MGYAEVLETGYETFFSIGICCPIGAVLIAAGIMQPVPLPDELDEEVLGLNPGKWWEIARVSDAAWALSPGDSRLKESEILSGKILMYGAALAHARKIDAEVSA